MIAVYLLLAGSVAVGAPLRPRPRPAGPDECARSRVLEPGVLGCRAVAVPPADLGDLLADRAWALQLQGHLLACEARTERPGLGVSRGVAFGAGVAVGVGALLGGAWVARSVTR